MVDSKLYLLKKIFVNRYPGNQTSRISQTLCSYPYIATFGLQYQAIFFCAITRVNIHSNLPHLRDAEYCKTYSSR